MTQLLFTLFLLTASAFNTIKAQGREPLTYNGSMDTIYDMFGNKKTLSDIQFNIAENGNPNVLGNTTFSTSCGYFNVYYAANSGMELPTNQNHINRRAVICQVLSDVSALIVSPLSSNPNVKVNFLVDQQSVASSIGAAGAATAYYAQASSPTYTNPGIADNEIWKTIHSGQNSYIGVAAPVNLAISGFYHGYMAFDFTSMNWNEQLTAAPSSTVMDLYTVALHEITHALGFASLISATASGKYGELNNYYSRYDVFLRNKTNLPLIINPGSISPMYGYGFNPSVAVAELTPAAT